MTRKLLSGNEAIALGAWEAGVALGCGYPGTPSTEIVEALHEYPDVYTEWSVNEKVAYEVALGAAVAGGRALVTMKHVGVNVAADPLFTSVYTGIEAGLVFYTDRDACLHVGDDIHDPFDALLTQAPDLDPFAFPVFATNEPLLRARQQECGVDMTCIDRGPDCHAELLDAIYATQRTLAT